MYLVNEKENVVIAGFKSSRNPVTDIFKVPVSSGLIASAVPKIEVHTAEVPLNNEYYWLSRSGVVFPLVGGTHRSTIKAHPEWFNIDLDKTRSSDERTLFVLNQGFIKVCLPSATNLELWDLSKAADVLGVWASWVLESYQNISVTVHDYADGNLPEFTLKQLSEGVLFSSIGKPVTIRPEAENGSFHLIMPMQGIGDQNDK
jgi:hypothetical protein